MGRLFMALVGMAIIALVTWNAVVGPPPDSVNELFTLAPPEGLGQTIEESRRSRIAQLLIDKDVPDCSRYSYEMADEYEYHVACWGDEDPDDNDPDYYILYTDESRVVAVDRPDANQNESQK